jgi:two-component system LytT family response regulator
MDQDSPTLKQATLDVVIVDDEPAARRTLRECCASEGDLRVVGEFGCSELALEAIRASPPDLLFLDVRIDGLTGIALARSLDPETLPLIVFVTAYDTYAVEAFEVSAVDYLLKPFDDKRFQDALARVRSRRLMQTRAQRHVSLSRVLDQIEANVNSAERPQPRVIAEAGGRSHILDVARIEIVEADRNYVRITVGRESYSARSTLQQAEEALKSQPMLKISRSCLVNMNHVREISRTPRGDSILILAGGVTVTSSEGFRDSVRDRLDRMRIR